MIPSAGSSMDIAPFGRISYWTGSDPMTIESHDIQGYILPVDVPEQGGLHIGIEWEYPRQFSSVVVKFKKAPKKPESVRLQYWVHSWPSGMRGGWTHTDDPYNGNWVTAHGEFAVNGDTWTFIFDPLDFTEIARAEDFAVLYRQAFRLRLLFRDGSTPEIVGIQVISDSIWREGDLRIEPGGKIEAYNGYIVSVDNSNPKSVAVKVLYAETHNYGVPWDIPTPPDRTIITVDGKFSFLATDALSDGVYVPDLGVFAGKKNKPSGLPLPIYDRILTEPEQTYERASTEIPQLIKTRQGRYCPIGCDANRQEFAVRYTGEIFADKRSLKVVGRDTAKLLWPGKSISFKFPTGDPPDFRDREDGTKQSALNGYLPIYTSAWKDREFLYEMTSFAALLEESPWDEEKKRGDEPMVALSKIKIRNTTEEKRKTRFWIVIENPEELVVDKDGFIYATGRAREDDVPDAPIQKRWIVDPYPVRRMRALLDTNGMGQAVPVSCSYAPFEVSSIPNAIAYDIELEPRTSHEIELFIPFITFTGDGGRKAVKSLRYDTKLAEMADYWQKQIDAGAKINVPDAIINDFNKATIPHIAITADKDIRTGYYFLPAGTYSYDVCMNEACHQIRALDYRGYHKEAEKYLRPFHELQGTQGLHGRFKSQEGVYHGLKVDDEINYQKFNYNLDHGYVMFALCEHYKFTRDKEWLASIANGLIASCDFVTRERQANIRTDANGEKVLEYGLIPPGHLEDNPEWLYWYAVNGYCYRGMKAVTEVLADIKHPDLERLKKDAAAFREDIRTAMKRSMELSPVTQLADGTYSPFVPTRSQLRGRDIGWIREPLYGPIHNIECEVLDPNEDMSTWILKDTEDNGFVSRYHGRQVDLEKYWFSQGGNTIQSGLLPIAMVYLKRDQPEHAIRAFYNSIGQNLYADVRCFTEHPVAAFGLGAGPFYKTPDENCWINWLRNILLMEKGDDCLIIAPGAPRAWFADGEEFSVQDMATYFGPMSYRIASKGNSITAAIERPKRNPPALMEVRFRHPEKIPIKSIMVNGKPHSDFDASREVIRFANAANLPKTLEITATY